MSEMPVTTAEPLVYVPVPRNACRPRGTFFCITCTKLVGASVPDARARLLIWSDVAEVMFVIVLSAGMYVPAVPGPC